MTGEYALGAAIIGLIGIVVGQFLASVFKEYQETKVEQRKSKQYLSAIRYEILTALGNLNALRGCISETEALSAVDSSLVLALAKPILVDKIPLTEAVNPILIAETLRTYRFIGRYAVTNDRDPKSEKHIVMTPLDHERIGSSIDRLLQLLHRTSLMNFASEDVPNATLSEEDLIAARENEGFRPMRPAAHFESLAPDTAASEQAGKTDATS